MVGAWSGDELITPALHLSAAQVETRCAKSPFRYQPNLTGSSGADILPHSCIPHSCAQMFLSISRPTFPSPMNETLTDLKASTLFLTHTWVHLETSAKLPERWDIRGFKAKTKTEKEIALHAFHTDVWCKPLRLIIRPSEHYHSDSAGKKLPEEKKKHSPT